MKKLFVIVSLLLCSALVHSDTLTATKLRTECKSNDFDSQAFCIGFLMGVHGTLQEGVPNVYCNMEVTGERLRLTYVNETEKYPALLDVTPQTAAMGAFAAGGVCVYRKPTQSRPTIGGHNTGID